MKLPIFQGKLSPFKMTLLNGKGSPRLIIHKYKILHQPFPSCLLLPIDCQNQHCKLSRENIPTIELFLCRQNSDLEGID